jgi:hypothetical protein
MSELSSITLVSSEGKNYKFENVPLEFLETQIQNKFAQKNNKTLKQTVEHAKYNDLYEETFKDYKSQFNIPIGEFLYQLKIKSSPDLDSFYRQFLNKYGDLTYCAFKITQPDRLIMQKGLYIYTVNNQTKYIGRCRDSFQRRINQGYGKIHPKNCYRDGQSTNCRVNSLIAENLESVAFYVHVLTDDKVIKEVERELIQKYKLKLEWNIQLN